MLREGTANFEELEGDVVDKESNDQRSPADIVAEALKKMETTVTAEDQTEAAAKKTADEETGAQYEAFIKTLPGVETPVVGIEESFDATQYTSERNHRYSCC